MIAMDSASIQLALNIGIPALLICFAYIIGSWVERRHFRRIIRKEDELRDILAFAIRRVPRDMALSEPMLVCGNAVISVDYFKKFAASLRGIIGGRVGTYESLYERARREAVIRMKEDARRQGGNIVLNVKLDSTRIHAGGRNATVSVEASAYGTSYRQGSAGAEIH
jgi:uncharacterized protein YbjQ (UPF0145 family)